MPTLDDFGRAFLRLALEIDRLIPGYVDAYYGPPEIKAEVAAAPPRPPADLLDDQSRLYDSVPAADPARQAHLVAVLRAMDCTLRMQAGEPFDYVDEVNRLYDITPAPVDEETFLAAHAELDAVLPEGGTLAERLDAWGKPFEIGGEKLLEVLAVAKDITRRRTREIVDLVDGEDVEVTLTRNQPWSAYNWYRGGARSLIEVNVDIPVSALDLLGLFAHEGYPGHHTEHQLKERYLYQAKGYGECAAALLHSPSAVIAEGIATTAAEIIFPGRDVHDWTVDAILTAANLPTAVPADLERVAKARRTLRYVSGNVAIKLHSGEMSEEQAVEYIQTYALATEARARQTLSFIVNPLFRAYIFTYTAGYDLIAQAAHGADKTPLFKRLLQEQILPSHLVAM